MGSGRGKTRRAKSVSGATYEKKTLTKEEEARIEELSQQPWGYSGNISIRPGGFFATSLARSQVLDERHSKQSSDGQPVDVKRVDF